MRIEVSKRVWARLCRLASRAWMGRITVLAGFWITREPSAVSDTRPTPAGAWSSIPKRAVSHNGESQWEGWDLEGSRKTFLGNPLRL